MSVSKGLVPITPRHAPQRVVKAPRRWWSVCRTRGAHDQGASAVEYALLIAGIAAIIIVAVTFVGRTVSTQFSKVGSSIASTS